MNPTPLRTLISVVTLLALGSVSRAANVIPADCFENGFAIGVQAYTFKEYSAFEAIAKAKEVGAKLIEFYPGQKLRPDSPKGEVLSHTMSDELVKVVKAECAKFGIRPVNYGVVAAKSAADVRAIMEFARKLELYSVCTESTEQVVEWEKAAQEFDIRVAFHEHGGSMSKPGYKVWHPLYILGVVESRDQRLGACADIGHWSTSGLKPVECMRILKGRIISMHFKDKAAEGAAPVVVAGKGIVDTAACLTELKTQKFTGHISIEHENDWKDNVPQVREDVDYIKAHGKK